MSTKSRLTLEEYDRMIERGEFDAIKEHRIELIFGELREMTPPGPTHAETVTRLYEWSTDVVDRSESRIWIQNPIGLSELESAPEPDVAWVKRKDYQNVRPSAEDVLLVIEVADSSLADDRGDKAILYAAAGIRDYWIVNIRNWCVEVYRDPAGDTYQSVNSYNVHDSISPLAFPNISLDVGHLFQA